MNPLEKIIFVIAIIGAIILGIQNMYDYWNQHKGE